MLFLTPHLLLLLCLPKCHQPSVPIPPSLSIGSPATLPTSRLRRWVLCSGHQPFGLDPVGPLGLSPRVAGDETSAPGSMRAEAVAFVPPRLHRLRDWRTRSLDGMPRSGWVVAPFGLTRGWSRSPQLPHSHRVALPYTRPTATRHSRAGIRPLETVALVGGDGDCGGGVAEGLDRFGEAV
jgi:hypothetical protein